METFAAAPHLLVSPEGDGTGFVDQKLAALGLERRIVLSLPQFLVAPFVVAETDLVATLAARVAGRFAAAGLGVAMHQPPIELPSWPLSVMWHRRTDRYPAALWLQSNRPAPRKGGLSNEELVMRMLVTGATGLIGGAVARRFAAAGHDVVALARSDASAARLAEQGYATVRGNQDDAASATAAARSVDNVVHAASPGNQNTAGADETATQAIVAALRGSSERFLYTSGCLLYGSTGDRPATEDDPLAPVDLVRFRQGVEARVLAAAADGVHSIVIRPGWVYGHNGGTAMMMVASATQHGRHVTSAMGRTAGRRSMPTIWRTYICSRSSERLPARSSTASTNSQYLSWRSRAPPARARA